jgi:2-polyprenyl-3-methyl-5-hydroxy-6-metoxy-1,4-benzoquinol methylase
MNDDERSDPNDARIVESWQQNAESWTAAVRERQIESRNLVTNAAVVQTILGRAPRTVLDIGCGEGWLARALAAHGIDVLGVDVVPELVERASSAGGGTFRVASYEDIGRGALNVQVDLAVANFSLIGGTAVDSLVASLPRLLTPRGFVVIQTLHPAVSTGEQPYKDGWRDGSWTGFSNAFTNPAPWFFRRIETWVRLLTESGLSVLEIREPLHPISGKPASLILVAQVSG